LDSVAGKSPIPLFVAAGNVLEVMLITPLITKEKSRHSLSELQNASDLAFDTVFGQSDCFFHQSDYFLHMPAPILPLMALQHDQHNGFVVRRLDEMAGDNPSFSMLEIQKRIYYVLKRALNDRIDSITSRITYHEYHPTDSNPRMTDASHPSHIGRWNLHEDLLSATRSRYFTIVIGLITNPQASFRR
jgi:hypothetical protein